jgi:Zn-dependent peptidase ImmA (M78 family)/DNA-binding XRE family transcriptional regulator
MSLFEELRGLDDDGPAGEFSATRLIVARQRRSHKKQELAELVESSPALITRFENGERKPDAAMTVRLAETLGFPIGFFFQGPIELVDSAGVSFRSRQSEVKSTTRDKAIASLTLACRDLEAEVRKRFKLPQVDLPSITGVPPHIAAARLRAEWKLGFYPIPNMIRLLEAKGIRVYWFDETDTSVDALCKVEKSIPYILLSQRERGGERMRFDLAHELGHLVMHRGVQDLSRKSIEDAANQFAASFLMPEEQFRKEFPANCSMVHLLNLKPRWGVSLQALIHRCFDLKLYSEFQYKSAYQKIGVNGWRTMEPGRLPVETSRIWEVVFDYLSSNGISTDAFASRINLFPEEIFSLVPYSKEVNRRETEEKLQRRNLTIEELGYVPFHDSDR